jgi:hypothetical protein
MFCLSTPVIEEFLKRIKEGEITPEKLKALGDEGRRNYFAEFMGLENAKKANALIESKLLLKNQEKGMITAITSMTGLRPEVRRDLLAKVERMEKILTPEEEADFKRDLAEQKLGVGVRESEAAKIMELATITKQQRLLMENGVRRLPGQPATSRELAYGMARVEFAKYYNNLKEGSAMTMKERLRMKNMGKNIGDALGISKSLKSTLDNSYIFRQGYKAMITNPKIWLRNATKSFDLFTKELKNQPAMDLVHADIYSRPNYDLYKKAGLAIDVLEESFPSTLPEKVPFMGRLFRASETAFTSQAQLTRADIFDKYVDIAKRTGVDVTDVDQLKSIARLTNALTGRGGLGSFESNADVFNKAFFAPRFVMSHFETLFGQPILGTGGVEGSVNPMKWSFAQKQAALNLAKIVIGAGSILGIADAVSPGSVEWDPRSANFGKIRVGDTRFDVTGGMSSLVTVISRVFPILVGQKGMVKSSTTGKLRELNTGDFGSSTGASVLFDFLEGKSSPVLRAFLDVLKDEDFYGDKPDVLSTIGTLFAPLPASNAYEALASGDVSVGLALIIILADALGVGASTYSADPKKGSGNLNIMGSTKSSGLNIMGGSNNSSGLGIMR